MTSRCPFHHKLFCNSVKQVPLKKGLNNQNNSWILKDIAAPLCFTVFSSAACG